LKLTGPMTWRLFRLYRMYASRRYGPGFTAYARVMRKYLEQSGGDLFAAVRLFESRRQLPNNYVMKVDKASMSVSIEARAPFLDRRVADLAYRTPSGLLMRAGADKALLREVARKYRLLPQATYERPKFGASIATSWMDEAPVLRDYARQVVLDPKGWAAELGLRGAMRDYFDGRPGYAFPRPLSIFSHLAWRLLLLNLWSRHYLRPGSAL
jgi:asparagine synthase (glutamine-hydrolysing)